MIPLLFRAEYCDDIGSYAALETSNCPKLSRRHFHLFSVSLTSCFCNCYCYYPLHSCRNRLKYTSQRFLIVSPPPLRSCPTPRSAASNASPRRCCLNKCCSPSLEPRPPRCSPAAPPCLTLCASSGSSAQSLLPSRRATS